MKCSQLDAYLDRRLEPAKQALFESHLMDCDRCRAQKEKWHLVATRVQADDRLLWVGQICEPSDQDIGRLVAIATHRSAAPGHWVDKVPRFVALTASALLVFGVAVSLWLLDGGKKQVTSVMKPVVTSDEPVGFVPPVSPGKAGSVLPKEKSTFSEEKPVFSVRQTQATASETVVVGETGLCVPIDSDWVCFFPGSRAKIKKSAHRHLVAMEEGRAAFGVTPGLSRQFVVTARQTRVTVTGTQFSVAIAATNGGESATDVVTVVVKKGTVWVDDRQRRIHVSGQMAVDVVPHQQPMAIRAAREKEIDLFSTILPTERPPRVMTAKMPSTTEGVDHKTVTRDSLETLKQLMIDGHIEEAISVLEAVVRSQHEESQAAFLLATCYKRRARYKDAASIYRTLAASGDASVANRAAYLAGDLLQHQLADPDGAINYYSQFLENSPKKAAQRAEALYHMAQSLMAVGRRAEASGALEKVVQVYGPLPIGQKARALLRQIKK